MVNDAKHFHDHGYLVRHGMFARDEIMQLERKIPQILDAHREILGLPSAGQLPDATRLVDGVLCLHHVHKISGAFLELAKDPRITGVLATLIGPNVKFLQSQLFIKPPGFPGNPWHQDEGPIPTRDRSLVGVWIAIDDSIVANGCLRVVPGSHRDGYLYPRREHHRPQDYDFTEESFGFDPDGVESIELAAGSAIFFHGYLLHGSTPNQSTGYRRAVTFHYMNAYSLLPWKGGQGDYRDVVPVLGSDPYEWRGYSDMSIPHLRRWPTRSREPSPDGPSYEIRRKISAAVGYWYHDERKAIELLRSVVAEMDHEGDAQLERNASGSSDAGMEDAH